MLPPSWEVLDALFTGHCCCGCTSLDCLVDCVDTVGDPFKDTSGPSLDILIKLMTMMSILFAPIYPEGPFDEDWWWVGLIIFVVFMILVIALVRLVLK